MKRNENTDTGEVSFHFNSDEWKKLKIACVSSKGTSQNST